MRVARVDRLWLVGGVLGSAALLAVGWFALIDPQYSEAASLSEQTVTAQRGLTSLEHRLVELKREKGNLEQYRAKLASDRQALPTTAGLSDFLRELQTAGTGTNVSVSGMIVGSATKTTAAGGEVFALPITLTAVGSIADLGNFLDELQQVQPRAVLISSVNAVPDGEGTSLADTVTLTVSLQVFVAPATAAGSAPAAGDAGSAPAAGDAGSAPAAGGTSP